MSPEAKARFEREARAVSSLASPHSVTAFDFGEGRGRIVVSRDGDARRETLGDRLQAHRPAQLARGDASFGTRCSRWPRRIKKASFTAISSPITSF